MNKLMNSQIEREYGNYPDSAIPIITILKLLATSQPSVRHELSNRADLISNVLRGKTQNLII